ncbi:cell division protein ZipA C-terminal FtsZ-binding domain-containing protein [Castellaniella sp.]|uniref:cell division protein ZipA C-terminal FtsZ-binding domain-containing protein n=1 Tax=Castellaniella sp. TaxID=1955812 RepID=UPI002AFF4D7C|nr:cell division protein ZipA C-terminal FtsZ-binding domain-containing protein [Castellaniella sp.]
MSELQILLISIGAALIVLVLLYNGWQEWRARRSMRPTLSDAGQDVLLQNTVQRREPGLWDGEPAPVPPLDDTADIDAACEAVIDIALAHPVPGAALAEALQDVAQVGKKPVRVFAQCEGGGYGAQVQPDESYVSVQLAVVMANRSGPLTAIEWSKLWNQAQNLAERFEGQIEAPEQSVVLSQAADLDARCAAMDAQVGLILQLASPRSVAAITQAAAEVGFVQTSKGWAWMAENGLPRFVLLLDAAAREDTHRVDLLLDVPNSIPDDQAFSRMVAVGRDLAGRLDAHVLDDQGRTFQDSSAPPIDRQISALYDQLDKSGFLAGTERTARIFS